MKKEEKVDFFVLFCFGGTQGIAHARQSSIIEVQPQFKITISFLNQNTDYPKWKELAVEITNPQGRKISKKKKKKN